MTGALVGVDGRQHMGALFTKVWMFGLNQQLVGPVTRLNVGRAALFDNCRAG